jgi:hypothetical protein
MLSKEQFSAEMDDLFREYNRAETIRKERQIINAIYLTYKSRADALFPLQGIDARLVDKPGVTL